MKRVTDQGNISLVLTDKTSNRKTGDMVQTWIIRNDMLPTVACKTGNDIVICGNCPHRSKSCYVNVGQAPQQVYRAMTRGSYDNKSIDTTGKLVRCGAYGDPAFISLDTWEEVLNGATGNTGYTHQWRTCSTGYSSFLMASCDSEQDRIDAKEKGYRTFRVRRDDEPLLPGEIDCPASINDKVHCEKCLLCDGNRTGKKIDISIVIHGSRAKNF